MPALDLEVTHGRPPGWRGSLAGLGRAAALASMGNMMAMATIRILNISIDAAKKSDSNLCTSPTMCHVQLLLTTMSTMTSNTKVRHYLDFATRRDNRDGVGYRNSRD